jgi:ribonuclease HII
MLTLSSIILNMLRSRHTLDSKIEAGIDEAGRGCLWGPLVAAAVIWPEESHWTEEIRSISAKIKDSKKLSAKQRAVLEAYIKKHAVKWSLGIITAEEIDNLGMTKSNRLAFERAFNGLQTPVERILIDGILGLTPREDVEQIVEPKGDGNYLTIAAASILAKEGRDTLVRDLCASDPTLEEKYSILSSKGYGTAKHREGVKQHGMHPLHRRLFLRKLLGIDHVVSEEYEFIDD